EFIRLDPGQRGTITTAFSRSERRLDAAVELSGMRGLPAVVPRVEPAHITHLTVFVPRPDRDHLFRISNVRAGGTGEVMEAEGFFPFIDEFGQYIHADWPGKTKGIEDLKAAAAEEARDLAEHPGPAAWNDYGGWGAGPELEATGFFRVEKRGGQWWLVDPAGRLFWSHGVDCVGRWGAVTSLKDRMHYFAWAPEEGSPLARFRQVGEGHDNLNFTSANAFRKYGEQFEPTLADLAHRRLRSWGMNTIGNWSDNRLGQMHRTPYVGTIHYGAPSIEASEGWWGKFPDPFDSGFRQALRERLEKERGRSAADPWCIGYFVDNELTWRDEHSLALATLKSPATQRAKQAFVGDLKARYATIDALNGAWGTEHASWEALLESREPPDVQKAGDDLGAFCTKIAEAYFRICRQEVKRVAPQNLYLGCRFHRANERVIRAAARYCDAISFNLYRRGVADFRLPDGVDKPVIVGEFHFGALDRGMFHPGLQEVANQQERAASYESYVRGALRNPIIVGTHWFQYGSQATTGRGDGENYQIGLLDVCDTPYWETIAACREVGYSLYEYRQAAH
ncbi:MAG: beta-agarase, partial [Planctomycetota bacterium]